MQEIAIKTVLTIHKSQLRSFIRTKMVVYPELVGKTTNKLLIEAMIFIKGYASAIEKEIMLPVIENDVQQLLLEQGFNYIKSKLE